ncbi:hypothetical protein J2125_001237 [Erwinia toletana]|uniref:Uncharacterized protein n=1 Tax=Winslowiella toletana TaxID=92490 RepID=A0ABS4P624_9GAMM|nr:hypothetical protein [Winslowiella toletana]
MSGLAIKPTVRRVLQYYELTPAKVKIMIAILQFEITVHTQA